MKKFRNILIFAGALTGPAYPQTMSYEAAKSLAERHENGLDQKQRSQLVANQGAIGGKAIANCSSSAGAKALTPFSLVMRLDSAGKVTETWLSGGAELGKCFESNLRSATLFVPPFVPFYTSFDLR